MALSIPAKRAMFSQETEEVIVALITVSHPEVSGGAPLALISSDPTVRYSTDPLIYATLSRGNYFFYTQFQLILPESSDDAPPSAKLVFDNTERELITLIRSVHTPAKLLIELVLASSPDVVEMSMDNLEVLQASYDVNQVSLSLGFQSLTNEPFPALNFSPSYFPGLFR